jgi:glutamate-ammonia-ligase adenylyltransferase
MAALRRFKAEAALAIALADLRGAPLETVTRSLTFTADASVAQAVGWLLGRAHVRGDWHCEAGITDPALGCGYFVIAMGKHGAFELNYSSDIDLVVLYEPEIAAPRIAGDPQTFFVKLTRDLVKLMSERTADGYVFRVDLRLRPDPGATHVAMSVPAALHYYESFGQNWERAAMIKARAIAGDLPAAERFLADLKPFIWRRNLDYAAIADIHAMKRQIHTYRGHGEVAVAGHNIKLGRGGIREIEFFTQTQQLIAGGRQPDLRVAGTLEALDRLAARGWIEAGVAGDLAAAYVFLRRLEHRLQMIADEQTQTLPKSADDMARLARFCGFADADGLGAALVARLRVVERHYARLFESVPQLTRGDRNMVFAGEQDDPQTLETLKGLGYADPAQVLAVVRGWHHGRYAAVSTPRGRERLTEVQPRLIEALAETIDPNAALAAFDRFLERLPAGVQLFSLLKSNPRLISVFALLMGSAPRLAGILSRRRRVIDTLLDPQMIARLPSADELDRLIGAELDAAGDAEARLDAARMIANEKRFLIGVRLLTGIITPAEAGGAYSLLAERLIGALLDRVEAEFRRLHGRIEGGQLAVLAMGKLGGGEMTAASDLDLILIYDTPADILSGDTLKPLPPSVYYTRLTQRLVSALTVPTAEGPLYEVDMRLRPSGQKGPLATSLASFSTYQGDEAWTWEHMALTRARVVAGPEALRAKIEAVIRDVLTRRRERSKLMADVREMRERISSAKGSDSVWDLKVVRGGLIDIEFIAQALQLRAACDDPEVLDRSTPGALDRLAAAGRLATDDHQTLRAAWRLFSDLTQALRVMLDRGGLVDAPAGVKHVLIRIAEAPSFEALEADLAERQAAVRHVFERALL